MSKLTTERSKLTRAEFTLTTGGPGRVEGVRILDGRALSPLAEEEAGPSPTPRPPGGQIRARQAASGSSAGLQRLELAHLRQVLRGNLNNRRPAPGLALRGGCCASGRCGYNMGAASKRCTCWAHTSGPTSTGEPGYRAGQTAPAPDPGVSGRSPPQKSFDPPGTPGRGQPCSSPSSPSSRGLPRQKS